MIAQRGAAGGLEPPLKRVASGAGDGRQETPGRRGGANEQQQQQGHEGRSAKPGGANGSAESESLIVGASEVPEQQPTVRKVEWVFDPARQRPWKQRTVVERRRPRTLWLGDRGVAQKVGFNAAPLSTPGSAFRLSPRCDTHAVLELSLPCWSLLSHCVVQAFHGPPTALNPDEQFDGWQEALKEALPAVVPVVSTSLPAAPHSEDATMDDAA